MALTLSKGAKNALDTLLALAGLVLSQLASGALDLPGVDKGIAAAVGVVGGYLVSDVVSVVNTGQAPPAAVVVSQVAASYSVTKPLIEAEIAKLPASQQAEVNLALAVIDNLVAKA